jgi:Zn-dependent protease
VGVTGNSAIQFDRVEKPGPAGVTVCARCQRSLDEYFELAGHMLCPSCAGARDAGAATNAFLRALLFGAGAAVVGLVANALLGSSPLIAVGVGLLVGYAVRKGAAIGGGTRYQALAMVLTALAIVITATRVGDGFELALVIPYVTSRPNFIGVIVLAIALYEAWKLNRRPPMSGPFRLTGAGVLPAAAVRLCGGCGAELAAAFNACPRCGRLQHADRLRALAADGDAAESAGDLSRALAVWRQALALLPAGSDQHARVLKKIEALSGQAAASASPAAPEVAASAAFPSSAPAAAPGVGQPARTGWRKWAAGAGTLGVVLLKLKWVLLFVLTKAKVLLLGLTQAKTFLSMAIALGVYASMYGWQFALGLIVSIYIHEMGHVVWLRRFGIPASAPMFIPGLGAFVRLKAHPATVGEDARVGLAGPVWGGAAAVLALALAEIVGRPIFFAIARVGAWINVFNLMPVWQLDGGRGFAALSRRQRAIVAAVAWLLALGGVDSMFFLVAIAATVRAATRGTAPERGDRHILLTFVGLLLGLAALMVAAGKR